MIRFAILAGVSTDPQAHDDKMSIPDQIANCRKLIAANGGLESSGPYIMDGYSRTGYDSLDVAMSEIPPLKQAVDDAASNQYDILIMDHFDRLGDLGMICLVRFKKLRKQLYSVRQSGRIIPPETYNPYADENADMQMRMHGMVQVYRINKIRRAWEVGIPDRAANGLHPLTVAFGYKLAGRNEPAVQVPAECDLIIKIKDWYLAGLTLQEICIRADQSGVKPRRSATTWKRTVVKRIVLNPYYAGMIIFGRYKKEGNKRIAQPPASWVRSEGKHKPLWDEQTYYAILAESARRDGLRQRSQTYALTGLVSCAVCGSRIDRHGSKGYIYAACRSADSHVHLPYASALTLVIDQVIHDLETYKRAAVVHSNEQTYQHEIDRLTQRRSRIQEGYKNELYTAAEAKKEIVAVETEIDLLTRKRDRAAVLDHQRAAMLQLAHQDLARLRVWLLNDDPTQVNHFLTSLCERVTISPQQEIKVFWRT